jgi:hypothetical protein
MRSDPRDIVAAHRARVVALRVEFHFADAPRACLARITDSSHPNVQFPRACRGR